MPRSVVATCPAATSARATHGRPGDLPGSSTPGCEDLVRVERDAGGGQAGDDLRGRDRRGARAAQPETSAGDREVTSTKYPSTCTSPPATTAVISMPVHELDAGLAARL